METKNRFKYCIWDVGKVIYDYNLKPLNDLMASLTKQPELFKAQKGVFRFDYNEYMKGCLDSFEALCTKLCAYCYVDYHPQLTEQIAQAFHQGIGERYQSTNRMLHFMKNHGIKNGILSNALPILNNTLGLEDLVEKPYRFTSYEFGLLKPDTKIFKTLIERLQVSPFEIIFIDDKEENVQSARTCGIQAIVYHQETIESKLLELF